ncbi:hypothetical protein MNBD_BACTEROID05-1145 [hydrothermal vent metagenome]|uniref:Phophatidylinositol-4-phosphate 5-kinase n=1 Tax=hydrothermal vent metagenome TaxID=652676 RepID=A0A3B0TQM4_9ZZZZ
MKLKEKYAQVSNLWVGFMAILLIAIILSLPFWRIYQRKQNLLEVQDFAKGLNVSVRQAGFKEFKIKKSNVRPLPLVIPQERLAIIQEKIQEKSSKKLQKNDEISTEDKNNSLEPEKPFLTDLTDISEFSGKNIRIERKTNLSPGGDYKEHVFYINGKVIARQKEVREEIINQSGDIPDGVVSFVNSFKKTHGTEYYLDGQLNGWRRIYSENGQIKKESFYDDGRLVESKEYYSNGELRFEGDYQDVRENVNDKENGIGKIYYNDGMLKYEWNITSKNKKGFKKAYNRNGELISEIYISENGDVLKEK